MRNINRIVIHCTATKRGMKVNAKIIDGWHRSQGYKNGCGYHFVILEDGTVETGRPIEEVGAHCLGYNNGSIGIVYCGGIGADGKPADTRTNEQKMSMNLLIARLRVQYRITDIAGHNEFSNKACPCFNVKKEFPL